MPITIAGSGTITGISAGGLPDDSIIAADIAAGAVAPAKLSTGGPSWTSGGDLSFNSGYGSVATAYGCRAWVNFNGTTASPSTIRASGNVSSVTKNGTGDYTVNFTNAMPDANYSPNINFSVQWGGGWAGGACYTQAAAISSNVSPTSSAFRFTTVNTAGTVYDPVYVLVSVFR